jgi:hypothetical protein
MKGTSAVVVIGVDRGEVGRDNGPAGISPVHHRVPVRFGDWRALYHPPKRY